MLSRILAAALAASSITHAASRAPQIFNAINNAMRQWGSSVHHNGMSVYLATVPEGVIFHHGNANETSPDGPEWLAYEIEHAESFARPRRGPPRRGPPGGGQGPFAGDDEELPSGRPGTQGEPQHAMADQPSDWPPNAVDGMEGQGGWLHTYRTTRPLRYLYVDGMSAGKTSMGTLDTQDYLLRGDRTTPYATDEPPHMGGRAGGPMDERRRASDLCEMCYYWDLSGIIRMEAGFEIIHCDFKDGLEQVQALQRQVPGGVGHDEGGSGLLEFMRALSERYDGIGSARTAVDFSSMVSAFFYPVNLTNPDPKRPDLPRLTGPTVAELASIKADVNRVVLERHGGLNATVGWQDVTDMVIARYADRLRYMAEKIDSPSRLLDEINHLLAVYIDYSGKDLDRIPPAIGRCADFYLHGISPSTEADGFIDTAIRTVTSEICTKLFDAREMLTRGSADRNVASSLALPDALATIRSLVEYLGWARFKRCPRCDVDEVCKIPMWPFGTKDEYESPRCANSSSIRGEGEHYWGGFGRPGSGRDGEGRSPW